MANKKNRSYAISYCNNNVITRSGAVWDKSLAIPYVGVAGWKEMLAGNEAAGEEGCVYWIER
jgi:hypothetical protein